MSPANASLLLDTNILVYLIRGQALSRHIDERLQLRARPDRPLISIVTVGEARSLARQLGWGEPKISALELLLRNLVVVDISHDPVLNLYAEMDAFLVNSGRTVGDNDVWIAACAAASGATLVSADRDFEPLADRFIRWEFVDPRIAVT